jgi:DNA (cytosine-5)-methyltransferase 1
VADSDGYNPRRRAGLSAVAHAGVTEPGRRRRRSHRPTVIDLFCGCGGGSIGFARAGFRVVGAVEVDEASAEAFRLNTGVSPMVQDVRSVTGEALLRASGLAQGECTALVGCPPCQSYTVMRRASPMTDLDALRETLPDEYLRLVREIRPKFVAFENVPGMREGRGREQFEGLEAGLKAEGYLTTSIVVDVADYGVPQHRRRLVLVGGLGVRVAMPEPTHSATPSADRRTHRTVRNAIGRVAKLESGEADASDALHRARSHGDMALRRLRAIPEGGGRMDLPDDLQLECHKDHRGHYDVYGRMRWDEPSPTITSGCTNVTRGRFAHPTQDRAITLREALLLQGFPRTSQLSGTDDQMARQVGNALPPPVAAAIAKAIRAAAQGPADGAG